MIHQQIPRHAGQPRRKSPRRRFVTRQRLVNPQENFLAQIVRVRRIAGEPVAQIEHPARVPAHKLLPRGPIPPETFLHQLGVGLQSLSASELASPFGLALCNASPGQNVPHFPFPRTRTDQRGRASPLAPKKRAPPPQVTRIASHLTYLPAANTSPTKPLSPISPPPPSNSLTHPQNVSP